MRSFGLLPAGVAVLSGILLLGAAHTRPSPEDDAATVAALDTKYQAAVEANDWAAMDAILADDFILVTGRGNVYTKADLLKEARNKTIVYEFQKDSAQTVRLWGNTAVVTALLKEK
jgi:ketosteroid isomerase-like protein